MEYPDFGMKTETTDDGVVLECSYYIPNYTLHDLMKVYETAKNQPGLNQFSGNPAHWPSVNALKAVVDICIEELYNKPSKHER